MAALVEIMIYVAIAAALFWAGMSALLYGWLGTIVAAVALFLAHRKWRSVRVWYYLRHRGWPLVALAWVAGAGAEGGVYFLYCAVAGGGVGRLYSLLIALALALVGAVSAWVVVGILRGRFARLVFAADEAAMTTVAGGDPNAAADPVERYRAAAAGVKFADLYGSQPLKDRLLEAAGDWKKKGKNGVLLYGPPGTGKTVMATALAGELGLPVIAVNVADLASRWVNATTENLGSLFDAAVAQAPCVLFMDEVESILADRATGGGTPEGGHITAAFLARATALQHSQVLLVAATNYLDRLDSAAIREGRFDFKVEVPLPDADARRGLIAARLAKAHCSTDAGTLTRLVRRWAGFNVPRIIAATDAACEAVAGRIGRAGVVAYGDFYAAIRRVQGAHGGAREGAKKLADLILEPAQESRLREIADQLVHVDEIETAGGTIPKGILFYGPPGTGKTATAAALAGEAGWSFIERNGRDLLDRGAVERLRAVAGDLRPTVVFLDEADDILADRQFSPYKMVTNELLTLVDGAGGTLPDVVWIAATNHAEAIDEAALRAGRFEQKVEFGVPTMATARRMIASWSTAHASRLDRPADAWADAVLPGFAGLTAANVFGALRLANNIAVTRARSAGGTDPVVTPEHVAEALHELGAGDAVAQEGVA